MLAKRETTGEQAQMVPERVECIPATTRRQRLHRLVPTILTILKWVVIALLVMETVPLLIHLVAYWHSLTMTYHTCAYPTPNANVSPPPC